MARDSNDAMSVTVQRNHSNNGKDYAMVHVPARVQNEHDISYGDEVQVEVIGVEGMAYSVRFTNFFLSDGSVTVPAKYLRNDIVTIGTEYEMNFDVTDVTRDGVGDHSVSTDSGESDEDKTEGLGELFG